MDNEANDADIQAVWTGDATAAYTESRIEVRGLSDCPESIITTTGDYPAQ